MLSNPRHRALCDRHDARPLYRVVSYGPAMWVWALLTRSRSHLACTQRSICLGAALASHLDPLTLSGDKRGLAKLCDLLCPKEHLFQIHNLSVVHPTQTTGPTDDTPSETSAKDIISARISFSPRAAIFPLLDRLPRCVAHDFSNPKNAVALGHDSSFFAVTQQQWRACVRRLLRCRRTCILLPSSRDPRLASGAFAAAKYEGRDRFIGDGRPLGSREKSTEHSYLPCYPRLRRTTLGRTETVQITYRATKDCFYCYEIPPSRVAKQATGPRVPRSWLGHLADENLDVVNAVVESWCRKISLIRVLPLNLSPNFTPARLG